MANQFLALPATAANGSGAAVDVSTFGALKTFTVSGLGGAYVTIEMSNQAVATKWSPVTTFQLAGEKTIQVAAHWLRATVSNYQGGGAPVVNVGGDDSGTSFIELVAPAGNGDGAGVDASALPAFMTVQVTGAFKGAVNIEISDDAGVSWSELASFRGPGHVSFTATAGELRVKRNGIVFPNGPTPTVFVAACVPIGESESPAVEAELTLVRRTLEVLTELPDELINGNATIYPVQYLNSGYTSGDQINNIALTDGVAYSLKADLVTGVVGRQVEATMVPYAPIAFFPAMPAGVRVTGFDPADWRVFQGIGVLLLNSFGAFENSIANAGPVVIVHESADSLAANRITTPTGENVIIPPGYGAVLTYDVATSRWIFARG